MTVLYNTQANGWRQKRKESGRGEIVSLFVQYLLAPMDQSKATIKQTFLPIQGQE